MVCFRVGAEDAEFLEKELLPEFALQDLVNLTKYNVYLRLMIDGLAGRPFSAETLPPAQKPEKSNREKIIKASRERYGTPREIVEEKIGRWVGMLKSPEKPLQPATSVLYDAQCALCGKWTKVIFPPDGSRPVYCRSCLKKIEREKTEAKEVKKEEAPANPAISLETVGKAEPVSFSPSKRAAEVKEKPKRKEVNIEELKKVLEETLKKQKE